MSLCAAGIAVAAYLTAAHYASSSILVCAENSVVNCTAVITSPQSVIAGIPVAVLGLGYFVVALPFMLPAAWRSPARWLRLARLAGVGVGAAMVVYLVYTELFTIGKICLYCTAVHVITVALLLVVAIGTALTTPAERSQL